MEDKHVMGDQESEDGLLIADFSAANFVSVEGEERVHPLQTAVMPVVAYRGAELRILGTGFAITNSGLMVTARHVIEECLEISSINSFVPGLEDQWGIGALYIAEPSPEDDMLPDPETGLKGLFGGILPSSHFYPMKDFDMGLLQLQLPVRVDSGAPIRVPALQLSPGLPNDGDIVLALGYHSMKVESNVDGFSVKHSIRQPLAATRGAIQAVHFPRRDSVSLNFPCFQVDAQFEGGMSGGPIININGGVIGVICSSFDNGGDGGHISYGSLIAPLLTAQVQAMHEGQVGPAFIEDFVIGGAVVTDESIKSVRFDREAGQLSISKRTQPNSLGREVAGQA